MHKLLDEFGFKSGHHNSEHKNLTLQISFLSPYGKHICRGHKCDDMSRKHSLKKFQNRKRNNFDPLLIFFLKIFKHLADLNTTPIFKNLNTLVYTRRVFFFFFQRNIWWDLLYTRKLLEGQILYNLYYIFGITLYLSVIEPTVLRLLLISFLVRLEFIDIDWQLRLQYVTVKPLTTFLYFFVSKWIILIKINYQDYELKTLYRK